MALCNANAMFSDCMRAIYQWSCTFSSAKVPQDVQHVLPREGAGGEGITTKIESGAFEKHNVIRQAAVAVSWHQFRR